MMNKFMVKFYENNIKYIFGLYNYYYYFKKLFDLRYDLFYKLYIFKFFEYIVDINLDLIIFIFLLVVVCVNNFKIKNFDINIFIFIVIIDVVDSMEWVFENIDLYFVFFFEIKNRFF